MLCLISHYYANKIYWRIIEGDSTAAAAIERTAVQWLFPFGFVVAAAHSLAEWQKTHQKLDLKTREINRSYLCNTFKSFQYEVHAMTGNGSYVNLLKLARKKFVKSHQVNLFLAGL